LPKTVKKDGEGKSILNIEPFFLEETIEDKKAFQLLIYLVTFIVERIHEIITIEGIDNKIITNEKEYQYLSCSAHSIDRIYEELNTLLLGTT